MIIKNKHYTMITHKFGNKSVGLFVIALLSLASCRHDSEISSLPNLYYDTDVKPIITANCIMCHSEYDSYDGLMGIVKPGKPHQSELYTVITTPYAFLRMPESPRDPLSATQRSIINVWILQGALESAQ